MKSTIAYQGKYIQVEEQNINNIIWEKAHFRSGVIVYPITDAGEIIMVKEFRPHETPQLRIKPVTGIFEPNLTPTENANKELQEEIGFKAKNLELILSSSITGSINSTQYFVAAWNLVNCKIPNPDGEETIQDILYFPFSELIKKFQNLEIPWGMSTLGLFRLHHLYSEGKLPIKLS